MTGQAESAKPKAPAESVELTAQQVKDSPKNRARRVPVPEWAMNGPAHVYVRVLGAGEIDEAQRALRYAEGPEKSDAKAVAMMGVLCICDSQGKRLFTEDDLDVLLAAPLAPLKRCFNEALEVNRLTNKTMDELAGNSAGEPADGSPSP